MNARRFIRIPLVRRNVPLQRRARTEIAIKFVSSSANELKIEKIRNDAIYGAFIPRFRVFRRRNHYRIANTFAELR